MSYGSLSGRGGRGDQPRAARSPAALQNTGEGGIADAPPQGRRARSGRSAPATSAAATRSGRFSLERCLETIADAQVRAIEIKLSQGAKPGARRRAAGREDHAGDRARSAASRRARTASARRAHSRVLRRRRAARLHREARRGDRAAGRHQVGRRRAGVLATSSRGRWRATAAAAPDFITIDGGEGGTGAGAARVHRPRRAAVQARLLARSIARSRAAGVARGRRVHRLGQARLPRDGAARARARLRHGQRRRARRCCRSAASRRSAATPATARPASRPRTAG